MALYQKITITNAGAALMSRILTEGGEPLQFEAVAIGSGELTSSINAANLTGLIQEAKRLPIEAIERNGEKIVVSARLVTATLTENIYHREVGIYANGILLAYGNTGDQYDFIPTTGNNAAMQKVIRIPLTIGTMQTTFAELDSSDFVTHAALESRIAPLVEPEVRKATEAVAEEALTEAVQNVATEIGENAAQAAYEAQVKAETAAANALVSAKQIKEDFLPHLDNDSIHVSSEEKNKWDNASIIAQGNIYSTGVATTNVSAYAYELTQIAAGQYDKISLSLSEQQSDIDTSNPFFLSVFEKDSSGNWQHIATSSYSIFQIAGETATYSFKRFTLSGSPIRIAYFTTKNVSTWAASYKIGIRAVTANGAGVAYTNTQCTTSIDYIPAMTLSVVSVIDEHKADTDAHVTAEERAKWNTPLNGYQLFKGQAITSIPQNTDLSKVMFAGEMCMNCPSLSSVAGLNMPSAMNMRKAFYGCPSLKSLDDASFENAEDCESAFENSGLQSCGYGMVFPNLRYARNMFKGSNVVDASNVYCDKLVDGDGMFSGCKLNSVTLEILQETINTVSAGKITLGISSSLQSDSTVQSAITAIRAKGWTVTVEYN